MKYLLSLLLALVISNAYAEVLFVPLLDFDNDSQKLLNVRVLEFWGYHDYQGRDVPIEAMITHRLTKDFIFVVGASKQLVQTYQQHNWSTYVKVSVNL